MKETIARKHCDKAAHLAAAQGTRGTCAVKFPDATTGKAAPNADGGESPPTQPSPPIQPAVPRLLN